MEEAVSGVKGQLATKIYGDDLKVLEDKGEEIVRIMRHVNGIKDLGLFRVVGQPNLNFVVDRDRLPATRSTWPTCRTPSRPPWAATPSPRCSRASSATTSSCATCPPYRDTKEALEKMRLLAPFRRTGLPCAALQGGDAGRRGADLPRGEQALCGGQVQRQGPRPGQHRRGGDGEGGKDR